MDKVWQIQIKYEEILYMLKKWHDPQRANCPIIHSCTIDLSFVYQYTSM